MAELEGLPVAGGATLRYGDHGRRAPLLAVHGWPLDQALWAPQVAAFAGERRLLTPDLVGAGASSGGGRDTVEAHAADLAALQDALGLGPVVLMGLSMGGYVALAFARAYPERLAGLVLADTRAEPDSAEARAGRYALAARVTEEGVGILVEELVPKLLAPGAGGQRREAVAAMIRRQPVAGVTAALAAMAARPDARPGLSAIAVPALVLVGAEDVITPPEAARALAAGLPAAEAVVLPGAGHLANLDEPGAFNAALRAFLGRLDGGA
jgi:pimeloyl-ACP methyl ester carboxylesterase